MDVTYKVEVLDEGGAGTGWHVVIRPTFERAARALAVMLDEPWAGEWRLTGPDLHLFGNERRPTSPPTPTDPSGGST